MYNNLRAEMTRKNISSQEVGDLIGKSAKSVDDKISGRRDLLILELVEIRDKFFPDRSLEYLAERS